MRPLENTAEAKRALRREMRAIRAAIDPAQKAAFDVALAARLLALPAWKKAKVVLCYLSTPEEVDTRPIIGAAWAEGKTVAVPRCLDKTRLGFFAIDDFAGLVLSAFGILEPLANDPRWPLVKVAEAGLIVVPGLAFDRKGYRLGYGGGYYDRLLAETSAVTVGLCYPPLLADALPVDVHDRSVDVLLTPKEQIGN